MDTVLRITDFVPVEEDSTITTTYSASSVRCKWRYNMTKLKYMKSPEERKKMPEGKKTGRSYGSNKRIEDTGRG